MGTPNWLAYSLAGLMIATSAYCAMRLVVARVGRYVSHRDVDSVHVLMGVAMAGMFVPSLDPAGHRLWELVFALAIVWFAVSAVKTGAWRRRQARGHELSHVVICGAMIYMLAAVSASTSEASGHGHDIMSAMAGHPLGSPVVVSFLTVFLLGYVVLCADRLGLVVTPRALALVGEGNKAAAARPFLAPRLASCCEIAMCTAMAFMLVTML